MSPNPKKKKKKNLCSKKTCEINKQKEKLFFQPNLKKT